jgi:hypothetical protein
MKNSNPTRDLSFAAHCINQLRHLVPLTIGNVCKGKFSPYDMHSADTGGRGMYSCSPSQPRRIMGVDDQHQTQSALPSGKTR